MSSPTTSNLFLSFVKPERIMPVEERQRIQAEGAPPGVYVDNMSDVARSLWRAKVVGIRTKEFALEIRTGKLNANTLIIVTGKPGNYQMRITANGPMQIKAVVFEELTLVVAEAYLVLSALNNVNMQAKALADLRAGRHPLQDII